MPLADLTTLVDATAQNLSQLKGLSIAYNLLGGAPSIAGYTSLINGNNSSNFGAGAGVTFNDENVYINVLNALYQGNADAKTAFDAIVGGGATLSDKLELVYNSVIPASARSDAGLTYFKSQAAFYEARAVELGVAGLNGAALVAYAGLAKIAVDNDIGGLGDTVNDLVAAVKNGTAALPEDGAVFTPLETADGTQFDGDDATTPTTTSTTLSVNQDAPAGTASSETINGVTTGAIATSTLQVSDVIDLKGGVDILNLTDTAAGASALGAGTLPTLNGVDIVNLTNTGGGALTFDTTFAPDATNFNLVSPAAAADGVVWNNATLGKQEFGVSGNGVGATTTVNFVGGDTGEADAVTVNLMGNSNAAGTVGSGAIALNGSTTAASKGGAETVNINSTGSANILAALTSTDSGATNVLKMVNVKGDQNLTVNAVSLVTGGTFDGSAATGALTALVTGAAGPVTVKGGTGVNTLLLDAIGATDTVDAGAGTTDTVGIFGNTAVAAGGMAKVTNAEMFAIAGTSTASQDVDNIGAFNSYVIASTGAGASFTDLANNANTLITSNATGTTVLELKTDGVADKLNVTLDNGAAGTAQTIARLDVDANGTGIVETLNIAATSTGGVTLTANNLTARDIVVTGGDNVVFGSALEAATTSFDASAATGNITVAANAAATAVSGIQTGSGNDNVTLQGAGGGDVTANVGAGNDTVTVAAAQEHNATLGAGNDIVDFNDLATKIGTGAAISTATEFLTIADFVGADDTIQLDTGAFGGLTAGNLLAAEYIEGTLASTAALDSQVEGIASAGGIGGAQAYIATIQIGTNVHVFYDADGHGTGGNVSQIAVLSSSDLANVSVADFLVA